MESINKSNGYEPTLLDVLEAVQGGFARLEKEYDRHEGILTTLVAGQQNIAEQVGDIQRRVINLEHSVEDVKESLIDITNAEEKDATATINHEQRISHLEKLGGIKSIPVAHLANLDLST